MKVQPLISIGYNAQNVMMEIFAMVLLKRADTHARIEKKHTSVDEGC